MAIGPVRGKSWGGLHGWLPVAQASTGLPLTRRHQRGKDHVDSLRSTREAGKDSLDSLRGTREAGKDPSDSPGRHQGGRKGWSEAPGRHQGGRKEPFGQPGRHQGGRKGSIGQPARHQGGTREAGKSHLRTGLPIESRFWKSAGFCITSNTISMAIGPVRGKSWGGLHGWPPVAQTGL